MHLSTYDPTVYSGLNEFEDAKRRYPEVQGHVRSLGDIICRHGLHHDVGVALLHKHFPITADERLVRYTADNRSRIYPTRDSGEDGVVPHLWKLAATDRGETLFPLEFSDRATPGSPSPARAAKVEMSAGFLEEIAARAVELGVQDMFGLTTAHHELYRFEPGEILVETTDLERRELTLEPDLEANFEGEDITETVWFFTPMAGPQTPDEEEQDGGMKIICVTCPPPPPPPPHTCVQHCVGHCKSHPQPA